MLQEPVTRKQRLPFYGSYAVFERIMDLFKKNGIPGRVDSAALRETLGPEAARGVIGLMGNGWTDDNQAPTADLRNLVAAYGGDFWPGALKEVLLKTYSFVPGDWRKITPAELHDAFLKRAGGKEVGVLKSSERFFLAAIQEAGIKPSVDFSYRTARLRQTVGATANYKHESVMEDAKELMNTPM